MSDLYSAADVLEKTLIANKDLPVYDGYPTKTFSPSQIGIVKKGFPAGIVYSWIDADPTRNRSTLYWMFYPVGVGGANYFMPHHKDDFDVSALRQQGVISVKEQEEEKKKKEEDANKEWYEKVMDRVVPIGAGVVIAAAVIKGLLSRK